MFIGRVGPLTLATALALRERTRRYRTTRGADHRWLTDATRTGRASSGSAGSAAPLAVELIRRGTEVLAIDSTRQGRAELSGQLTHVVAADATDMEALRQLGVAEFRRAVVAIGTDMEASILTTSLLVDLGIADIWAKAISRQHGRDPGRVGAHHVVFPEHDMGERVAHLLSGQDARLHRVDEDFAMVKIRPPREVVGVPLGETRLRSKTASRRRREKPRTEVHLRQRRHRPRTATSSRRRPQPRHRTPPRRPQTEAARARSIAFSGARTPPARPAARHICRTVYQCVGMRPSRSPTA